MPSQTYPLSGWHDRATLHPLRDTFVPEASKLQYGLERNAPVGTSLIAAIFAPDFVVDAAGRVLKLVDGDQEALNKLVESATGDDVPKVEEGWNQWRIRHPMTSQPIYNLLPFKDGRAQKDRFVSVYGHSASTKLQEPVHGLTDLPAVLQETFTVLREGSKDRDSEGNPEVVQSVMAILESRYNDD
ncbi:hypothetical protein DL93DRAFT_1493547 [Clavulina sp. PMI_390]|nr:hypothetical protein DL93DRAFT_1493547 [Clavulina sp. PMI_390]